MNTVLINIMSTVDIGLDCSKLVVARIYEVKYSENLSHVKRELMCNGARFKNCLRSSIPQLISLLRMTSSRKEETDIYKVLRFCIRSVHEIGITREDFHAFRHAFTYKCMELRFYGVDADMMDYYIYIFPRNFY